MAVLAISLAGLDAAAVEPGPAVGECSGSAWQRVLAPVATPSPPAHAIWLDGRMLRWPGQPETGRYRLLHSADGALVVRVGSPAEGVDDAGRLQLARTLAPALAARFRHVGAGAQLALAETDRPRLREWVRGQLVIVREDDDGRVLAAASLQAAGALDDLHAGAAAGRALGARVSRDATQLDLWAPTATRVAACVFAGGDARRARLHAMVRDDASGVWNARLRGDRSGDTYVYLVDVFVPDAGRVRNRVTDPYALSLDADSRHAWIGSLDDARTKPAGWDAHPRPAALASPTDMVIYEVHVRDFSIGDSAVAAAHRGKYLAFADARSGGMRHLRALAAAGLTDVHLLPVFDFASVPELGCVTPRVAGPPAGKGQQAAIEAVHDRDCFNWGYDPWHYTAPEGSYASDAADPVARVPELRTLVQALHGAGLRVGMDVVYNHTSASGQHAQSVLDRIVPGYYHRLDADGRVERSTCCDNTATEHAMMARLMIDSAVTWARDYRIDSFRFDLMGHQPRAAMEELQVAVDRAAGRHVDLIGEGWNFGEIADGARFVQASQQGLGGSGIATFSDRARDAVRGGGCCDKGEALVARQGWINGQHYAPNARAQASRADLLRSADLVRVGLAGSLRSFELETADGEVKSLSRIDYDGQPAGYAEQPGEVVNYVENHDNPTLFDINVLKLPPSTSADERARVQVLALALPALSQGIAYYHAGSDLLRSKSLDRNSFDSGDWFNRLDWSGRTHAFGSGLPRAADNGADWALLAPFLADPSLRPDVATITWTRAAFLDLLRLRASTPLLRLRSAEDVRKRLRFHATGPAQPGALIAATIDGAGMGDAGFAELAYFINADQRGHEIVIDAARGKDWQLHPVQRAASAVDARPREQSRVDRADGRFHVPARSVLVYVVETADGPSRGHP